MRVNWQDWDELGDNEGEVREFLADSAAAERKLRTRLVRSYLSEVRRSRLCMEIIETSRR